MKQPDIQMHSQLGGCTEHWTMDRSMIDLAVTCLLHCVDHGGTHHFAITGDGMTLSVSPGGQACLRKLAHFRAAMPELATDEPEPDGPRMYFNRHASDID